MFFKLLSVDETFRGKLTLIKKMDFFNISFLNILWRELFSYYASEDDAVFCTWHSSILTCAWICCYHVIAEVQISCSRDSIWSRSLPANPCMQTSFHPFPSQGRKGKGQEESDRWCMSESCPTVVWGGKNLDVDQQHSGMLNCPVPLV